MTIKSFKRFATIAACFLVGGSAFAQNVTVTNTTNDGQPGSSASGTNTRGPASSSSAAGSTQRSEAQAKGETTENKIGVTNFALRPTAGAIFFNGRQKFAGGALLDFNLADVGWMKIGPAFGALYSPVDSDDFVSGISTSNDNYIFQIPANLKVTFSPDPANRLQLGVHGGANIIRSAAALGNSFGGGTTSGGTSWDAHGNVGADIDYALATNIDITLRPDVTFLEDFEMVTTTIGLGLKL